MIMNEEKGYFIQSLKKTFRFYNNNNSSYRTWYWPLIWNTQHQNEKDVPQEYALISMKIDQSVKIVNSKIFIVSAERRQ